MFHCDESQQSLHSLPGLCAFRATIVDFRQDPAGLARPEEAVRCFEDGLLVVDEGKVVLVCPVSSETARSLAAPVIDYSGCLLMPGFIDTHVHYAQMEMIASYGEELLAWLQRYTFPTESRFADPAHAAAIAQQFVAELLSNGTTSALVFATSHPQSVDALFAAASKLGMRLITGQVLMDRHAPVDLLTTPDAALAANEALIAKWHGKERLLYALTPRFVPSCSDSMLAMTRRLQERFPDVYLQSHIAENRAEVEWVKQLCPEHPDYLGVYEHYGLLHERAVFAHGVHLSHDEYRRLGAAKAALAHCPASNLFLGSGLFDFRKAARHAVNVSLGTDVGAGNSFSMLRMMSEAYKVAALAGNALSAFQAFYWATLGGAKVLALDHLLGNFAVGKEADFVVFNPRATPIQKLRTERAESLHDILFSLMMLGDDRSVEATYLMGQRVFQGRWVDGE